MIQRTLMMTVAAALASGASAVPGDPLLHAPWRPFDTGDFPTFAPVAVAVGDLDADGVNDLVAAREFFGGPGLSVLFGRANGTFEEEVLYTLPFSHDLQDVALSDIDQDGDLDAVASVYGNAGLDTRIVLYRNNGTGAFEPPNFFPAGDGPAGVVIADFTGDGWDDVVVANSGYVAGTDDTISLLVHNGEAGDGAGFLAPAQFTVGDNATRVAAGDLDGDGDLDVAVGRGDFVGLGGHGLSVLLNDGTGEFGPPTHYDQAPGAYRHSPAVALADMDNDGDLDLLGGGATQGSPSFGVVSIRFNDGSGTFGAPIVHNAAPWTFTPHTITTADLNNDGWQDILVSTPSGRANDGFNVIINDPETGLSPAVRYDAGKQTFDIAVYDSDGDGDLDVHTVANDSSVITVHHNPGDGTFYVPTRYALGFLNRDMVEGDIDLDGDVDLVAGGDDDVFVLRNEGDATFPPAEHINTPFSPSDILLADMNNDGWLDLVIRAYDFAVALNDMEGGFLPAIVTPVGASQAGEVGVFDLDNDGDLDVVCTDPGPASRVYLFRNHGSGTFFTLANIIADDDGLPFGVDGGDLNHDGDVDLIFNNALGLTVYFGNGDFTVEGPFPTGDYGYPFLLHDMNTDGDLDLVYKRPESYGKSEIAVMTGFGDGGFGFPKITTGPNGRESPFQITSDVDAGDIDGDGIPDALFTNNAPNDVSVFLGAGDGSLLEQDRYGAGYSASDSVLADLDGDGDTDVATVISLPPSGLSNAVVVLPNIQEAGGILGDIDGDGVVGFSDLLSVLAAWGPCPAPPEDCPADIDGSGSVDFPDLVTVLANWS